MFTPFPPFKKSTESNEVPRTISLQETQGMKEQVKQHNEALIQTQNTGQTWVSATNPKALADGGQEGSGKCLIKKLTRYSQDARIFSGA